MIILNRVSSRGEVKQFGLPVTSFSEANPDTDKVSWIKYWSAQDNQVRSCKVAHTLQEIQTMVFTARHGKAPAKGLLK